MARTTLTSSPAAAARLAAICLGALLSFGHAAAQQPDPTTPPDAPPQRPEKPKPVKWPKLRSSEERAAKRDLRLLAAEEPEVAATAEAALIELGVGVAPLVMRKLDDSEVIAEDALVRVLDAVMTAEYLPKLLQRADDKSVALRRWIIDWLARARDPRAKAALEQASGDEVREIASRAWIGRLGMGDEEALEPVLGACAADWHAWVGLCAQILPPVRDAKFADALIDRIAGQDQVTRVAGLRLLRYLAPPSHANLIGTFLGASENGVKKAAINALRVVVDGDEPLEKLSVFQAIDMARAWKERLK